MSDNPLLPHSKLRELHALMLRCRDLERKHRSRNAAREGLLAGTAIHMKQGDLLSAAPNDPLAPHLAPKSKRSLNGTLQPSQNFSARLFLCAAAARGMQAAEPGPLVLAFVNAGDSELDWQPAMEWAHKEQLPLILAGVDATGGTRLNRGRPSQHSIDFKTASHFARRSRLPLFPVDGEDAVAVYRVMQECTLRARFGGGPAILWSVLTPVTTRTPKLKRSASPLARLESYMASRDIPLT